MFKKRVEEGQFEGVHFVNGKVNFQSFGLNVFCFVTDGVLIDTSSQSLFGHMKPFFESVDVEQVLLTHNHEDHTGGAHYFAGKGLPVFIHKDSVEDVTKKANYPMYRKLFWGSRKPFVAQPLGETFESRSATWDVIATSGHTDDHLSFLNRESGMLFTGDLYVSPKVKVILRNESVPQIVRSINHVLTYDFETVICNHAGIVKDGRAALIAKRDNLCAIIDEVLTLQNKGMGIKDIHKELFPKTYPIKRFSLGEWDSIHVVTSILNDGGLKGSLE